MKFAVIEALSSFPDLESGDKFEITPVVNELFRLGKIGENVYRTFIILERKSGIAEGIIEKFRFRYVKDIHIAEKSDNREEVIFHIIHKCINDELQQLMKILF